MAKKKSASKAKPKRVNPQEKVEQEVQVPQTKKEKKEAAKKTAITIFSILIAISMMLPMIGTIVASKRNQRQQDPTQITMTDIDGKFAGQVYEIEKKANNNKDDLASQLNLGQAYLQWGASCKGMAKSDDDTKHANELIEKAQAAYDQAIKVDKDSVDAHIGHANCISILKGEKEALSDFEPFANEHTDNSTVMLYMGSVYAQLDQKDKAKEFLNKVIELDPENKDGNKDYAQSLIDSLDNTPQETDDTDK